MTNEYYIQNKKIILTKRKEFYDKNKVRLYKAKREYLKNNPEAYKKQLQYLKEYRAKHKQELKTKHLEYVKNNRPIVLARMRRWNWQNNEIQRKKKKEYYYENKEIILKKMSETYHTEKTINKLKVFQHYCRGEPYCVCCGYTNFIFLTIDHIYGRHTEKRKLTGNNLVEYLIKENYPDGYQILCWNCNCTKGFFGQCSHKFKWEPINKIRKIKLEFLKVYSDKELKCKCCGESNIGFLTIDHIDGHRQPEEKGMTTSLLYYYLKKKGFPPGYQVLCYNCNCAKGNNKECPHKTTLIDTNINKC